MNEMATRVLYRRSCKGEGGAPSVSLSLSRLACLVCKNEVACLLALLLLIPGMYTKSRSLEAHAMFLMVVKKSGPFPTLPIVFTMFAGANLGHG